MPTRGDHPDDELRRYLFVERPIGAFVINFVLNGLIAWAICRDLPAVPLWGQPSVAGDTIATSFILPFLSVLIATPLVWRDVRGGKPPPESLRERPARPRWLPRPLMARAIVLGLVAMIVASPLALAPLVLAGVTRIAMPGFVWAKATYAAALGAVLAPTIAVAGLADAHAARRNSS
jgi:hypothetical protein